MLSIGEAYVRATIPDFIATRRRELALDLRQDVELAARELVRFDLENVELEIRIEEGSVRIKATARVALTVLVLYGGVRTAIDYAANDGRAFAAWLVDRIPRKLPPVAQVNRVERRTRDAGRLKRLFDRVERGDLSAEEAFKQASRILERSADEPEEIRGLRITFRQAFEEIEYPSVVSSPFRPASEDLPDRRLPREEPRGFVVRKTAASDEWEEEEY